MKTLNQATHSFLQLWLKYLRIIFMPQTLKAFIKMGQLKDRHCESCPSPVGKFLRITGTWAEFMSVSLCFWTPFLFWKGKLRGSRIAQGQNRAAANYSLRTSSTAAQRELKCLIAVRKKLCIWIVVRVTDCMAFKNHNVSHMCTLEAQDLGRQQQNWWLGWAFGLQRRRPPLRTWPLKPGLDTSQGDRSLKKMGKQKLAYITRLYQH